MANDGENQDEPIYRRAERGTKVHVSLWWSELKALWMCVGPHLNGCCLLEPSRANAQHHVWSGHANDIWSARPHKKREHDVFDNSCLTDKVLSETPE
jgi:hypothetical protein